MVSAALICGLLLPPPAALMAQSKTSLRVLFIGNSLTASNDLPGMIAAMARSSTPPLEFAHQTVALPDYGLEEHWNDGGALRAIRRQPWTHVVLQQGPSSLMESRCTLVEYGKRFARAIQDRGAEPVFYGVWPPRDRRAYFDAVTESYAVVAALTGASLAPAGHAWQIAWQRDPGLPLYGADAFHPSRLGTYLAALVIFRTIAGQSFSGPSPGFVSPQHAETLRQASVTAVAETQRTDANVASRLRCP
jgi:hypothetical protein